MIVIASYRISVRLNFRSAQKNMDIGLFNFRLLRAHMHHTPTHARWLYGKIFVLSSKRTNFRTDKKTLYGVDAHTKTGGCSYSYTEAFPTDQLCVLQ